MLAFTVLSSHGMYPVTGAARFKVRIFWVKSNSGAIIHCIMWIFYAYRFDCNGLDIFTCVEDVITTIVSFMYHK